MPAPDGKNAVIREGCILDPSTDQPPIQASSNDETKHDPSMIQERAVLERGREGKGREGIGKGREEEGKGKEGKEDFVLQTEERPQDIFGGGDS